MHKKILLVTSFILLVIAIIVAIYYLVPKNRDNFDNVNGDNMLNEFNVNILINGNNYTAIFEDNITTRELISILPFEINMNELNDNEKYYYFSTNFQVEPKRVNKINAGDIMMFGNNCLVIFYESFNTSYSYTRIGHISNTQNLKEDLGTGSVIVKFSN